MKKRCRDEDSEEKRYGYIEIQIVCTRREEQTIFALLNDPIFAATY